jgi:hypothetical protein
MEVIEARSSDRDTCVNMANGRHEYGDPQGLLMARFAPHSSADAAQMFAKASE